METTKLSSRGQVIIPKSFRSAHHWEAGQKLLVVDMGNGVLLKPEMPFEETCIDEVAACLEYVGKPKTQDDMNAAILQGVRDRFQ